MAKIQIPVCKEFIKILFHESWKSFGVFHNPNPCMAKFSPNSWHVMSELRTVLYRIRMVPDRQGSAAVYIDVVDGYWRPNTRKITNIAKKVGQHNDSATNISNRHHCHRRRPMKSQIIGSPLVYTVFKNSTFVHFVLWISQNVNCGGLTCKRA